jgi:RNA polymerase sigma-70 factor (ECF subfamily)
MPPEATIKRARVNGQPGIIISLAGQPVTVVTLDLVDGRIAHCYAIRNPEKLARVN